MTRCAALLTILTTLSVPAVELKPTPDVGAGPNHRPGAPYRAKLSPPLAEGTVLLIRGHVRAADTGEGIPDVVLDAFHADARGTYDMDGHEYRARVRTDESGYFEFETVRPANYGPPPHIHFVISGPGYRTLKTSLQFADDLERRGSDVRHPELVTDLTRHETDRGAWEEGRFDVVLVREE